jgi:uncharacterized protein
MSIKKDALAGKLAVVTGASSGIGASTGVQLAKLGFKVGLVARRKEKLDQIASEINRDGGQAVVIPADLSVVANYDLLYRSILENYGPIDILINNAGFGWYGYFADMPLSTLEEMLQVNLQAAIRLTRLVLPDMCKRNSGHIIHIGSIAGNFPNQGVALYSATKSFLDAFNTALYRELRTSNVHTSIVNAGPVHTEFFQSALNRPAGRAIPAERWGIFPDQVARRIVKLIHHPRRRIFVPGWLAITPWVELFAGWLPDLLGPLLLKSGSEKNMSD